jgi:hypothetical protein
MSLSKEKMADNIQSIFLEVNLLLSPSHMQLLHDGIAIPTCSWDRTWGHLNIRLVR